MLAKSECVRCIRGRKFCGGNKEGVNGGNKYGGGGGSAGENEAEASKMQGCSEMEGRD